MGKHIALLLTLVQAIMIIISFFIIAGQGMNERNGSPVVAKEEGG